MNLAYRKCVVAVVKNDRDLFLVGERADTTNSWQFPQGGIDGQELPRSAVIRELSEEIGCSNLTILQESAEWITYDFPSDLNVPITKKYRGQSQRWFLLSFNDGAVPDLTKAEGEFQSLAWKPLSEILAGIVYWKRDAYRQGLHSLGLV